MEDLNIVDSFVSKLLGRSDMTGNYSIHYEYTLNVPKAKKHQLIASQEMGKWDFPLA